MDQCSCFIISKELDKFTFTQTAEQRPTTYLFSAKPSPNPYVTYNIPLGVGVTQFGTHCLKPGAHEMTGTDYGFSSLSRR